MKRKILRMIYRCEERHFKVSTAAIALVHPRVCIVSSLRSDTTLSISIHLRGMLTCCRYSTLQDVCHVSLHTCGFHNAVSTPLLRACARLHITLTM